MTARKPRREPAAAAVVVYLIVERATGKPVASWVNRADARLSLPAWNKRGQRYAIRRCEVLPTKRKGGGA